MKHALSAGLMLIFSLFGPDSGYAQPMTTSTPTTKILAIGTINPGVDAAKVFADPAERSSRHRGPLPKWQDRSVVLAAGT
jgi:hypothetical protein